MTVLPFKRPKDAPHSSINQLLLSLSMTEQLRALYTQFVYIEPTHRMVLLDESGQHIAIFCCGSRELLKEFSIQSRDDWTFSKVSVSGNWLVTEDMMEDPDDHDSDEAEQLELFDGLSGECI